MAGFATSLGWRLRAAGVEVGLSEVEVFSRALALDRPARRTTLYWLARITLVRRESDLGAFDAVFATVFADAEVEASTSPVSSAGPLPRSTAERRHEESAGPPDVGRGGGLPWVRAASVVQATGPDEYAAVSPLPAPSDVAVIADRPFAELDPEELSALESALVEQLARARSDWPSRASRRMHDHRHGRRISLRRTVARSRQTGFEPLRLHRERRVHVPRRLVLICDVSESMQPYAAAYLRLMRAAAMVTRAEVFAFSTSLTRLTGVLTHRSPEVAMALAEERVTDRFGGTRIAANLRRLLASHHGGSVRGAVVVIASDGWDSDDPGELARVMARLQRRAHQVIWLNPRVAAPGYQPLVGAMAAALPHCDALVPGATESDLNALLDAVVRAREGRFGPAHRWESADIF